MIQSLYNLKRNYDSSTLQLIHTVLHGALKQAAAWDLIAKNPASSVVKPKKSRKEMSFLTQDQAQAIFLHLAGSRWEALYYLAISLGLRRGELLALNWDDVDWARKTIRVTRQAVYNVGRGVRITIPKTKYSQRTLPLGNTAIDKLKKHQKLQRLERAAVARWEDNNLIFPNTEGKMYYPSTITKQHQEVMQGVGISNVRFHDLRHTAATIMLQQGIHPRVVQQIMGHSTISITLGTYSHVTPDMIGDAASVMDEALTPIAIDLKPN